MAYINETKLTMGGLQLRNVSKHACHRTLIRRLLEMRRTPELSTNERRFHKKLDRLLLDEMKNLKII